MGNVNMEASQVHVRDNSHKTWRTVADALTALEASSASVEEDIEELYTRDSSRASKDDITNEFDAETTYHISDYVYHEGTLFKFIANHSGEWDPDDVIVAQIGDDLADAAAALNYSTTEQPTGQKWIDDKEIYFKTIEFGALPASTQKDVATGLTGVNIVKMEAVATSSDDTLFIPYNAANNYIGLLYIYSTNSVRIWASTDLSNHDAYVTIYYTKTA